jgi:hypothetical protein
MTHRDAFSRIHALYARTCRGTHTQNASRCVICHRWLPDEGLAAAVTKFAAGRSRSLRRPGRSCSLRRRPF